MSSMLRSCGVLWQCLCLALCLLSLAPRAHADDLGVLAIVSDRSAPTVVAGAHQLLDARPAQGVQVRSLSQLARMDDAQLQALVARHDAVLMLAVFGESVERLLALKYPKVQLRFVLHSDRRLLPLQHDRYGNIFASGLPAPVVDEKMALFSPEALAAARTQYPQYAHWLQARAYWINRSADNAASLLNMISSGGERQAPVRPVPPVRYALHGDHGPRWLSAPELLGQADPARPTLWLLDHDTGDLSGEWALHERLCDGRPWQCISVLAAWGEPSLEAIRTMTRFRATAKSAMAVVAVQDFVIGGGEHREDVTALLTQLDVPVLKALRQRELTEAEWRLSNEGVPAEKVHYRLAMPELQGISQPQVLAVSEPERLDERTGASVAMSHVIDGEVERQARRLERWMTLQTRPNADKRVAIVYYNHPPGRHNIGADNLNVPESLLDMLRALKAAGYTTGTLPADGKALLDRLQAQGVNLPEDADALAGMAPHVASLDTPTYRRWFETLPAHVKAEMTEGPVAALRALMRAQAAEITAIDSAHERAPRIDLLRQRMHSTIADLHHAIDGARHKGRARALDLLGQLDAAYDSVLNALAERQTPDWPAGDTLATALIDMQIEGIRGWGPAPGKVMVWQGRQLIPGVQFGNVFIGPQPPRGWELNEELLHANMSFPPPHQYLGFYHYLKSVFKADALIHVGRHSTYEFLPKRSAGLAEDDYPSLIAGDLPGIYPYIVDGVGEGIQAKRRGLAVMVDHLTPPLAITELYDDLLEIRQLIESAEATTDAPTRRKAVLALRERIDTAGLRDELEASMDEELKVRGVRFEEADDEMLLHEVGHYLTKLQEDFMPLGLHVFGREWSPKGIDTMLASMADGATADGASHAQWRQHLTASPGAEMAALLAGLDGRFVAPGKGNDPIRTPEALPTGRNFFALDGSLLPTKLAWETGAALADDVLSGKAGVAAHTEEVGANKQGIILWASDAVRDEGTMIAFGLKLLGVKPVWNSRGIIKGLERLPLDDSQPKRYDVVFTTSGLFRDLYGQHMLILDKASLAALDASRATIEHDYPALSLALAEALNPLGEWQRGGDEPLAQNQVAANWVDQARKMLQARPELTPAELGRQASARVFGIAPGAYGAGVNRMVERSGAWQDRAELAEVFTRRMGHAYGAGLDGVPAQALFETQLQGISQTYLGRASNLYGLMDNNDAFDYLGGFNMAVEHQRGAPPASAVVNHANARDTRIDPLHSALLGELRGRFLNPQWIKPLMDEGYSGARTMGNEFIEYLWGWQVTSPEIIDDRVWEEVKAVYVDDKHDLGLDRFLADGHNRYVQTNILAVMLVAIDKGFWAADAATRKQLAEQFATNLIEHGNPGSGHTHANHPMYDMVKAQLSAERAAQLDAVLARSRLDDTAESAEAPAHIQEVRLETADPDPTASQASQADTSSPTNEADAPDYLPWLAVAAALLLLVGATRGRRAR
ncbi:cobaltochelatase subunit CobN [Nitrogeniibacter aestuarii]|uniref:cobaltochelatase subunit CobN n=1 Tax=Nitrogeniibacter aestuarii TaxID=2815343 RepID=UPI001D12B58A|nr:cobaltochelatase subunit CobN [Nitrogeniibacter aestuarii]